MTIVNNINSQETSYWNAGVAFWDNATAQITAFDVSLRGSKYTTIAEKARKFVQKNVLFSSTFPNRNSHFRENDARSYEERHLGINNGIREVRSSIKAVYKTNFDKATALGTAAIKYSIGNCMEMASAAFIYLLQVYPDVKVDIYRILGGDHCFLVIGRDLNSDPSDPETWGPHTMICDPWSKKSFPVSELYKLQNYGGRVWSNGEPVLRKLDFNTQTLGIWTSNHLTEKDLEFLAMQAQLKTNCISS